jgi:aminopeptidase N
MKVPVTTYLKDYCPPSYAITHTNLTIEVFEKYTEVRGTLTINRQSGSQAPNDPLVLDGLNLELISICLDGSVIPLSALTINSDTLTIPNVPASFTLETIVRINPKENTLLEGLYASKDGLFTQCEAEGFRRITYFLDRPDVMSLYTTTIIADKDKYPILLSNGNLDSSGSLPNGNHWARWIDPFPKPSYLFAMVAGKLDQIASQFVTASERVVDLIFYVEPGKLDQCEFAIQCLKAAMKWDEEVFGLELDLDQYMIVAVSDFNMGAMENKGLNIFNTKYVLARSDTATDYDFMMIDRVIAHEYFHNWTGNRVTCRDWFQLSLKEGLTVFRDQRYGEDRYSHPVQRIQEVRVLRASQFPEDASPMAHPVRPDAYIEISNFYTATVYNKGAEVVRMIHTLIGAENFRKGMDLYFARHDGQAVCTEDFVDAMSTAANFDFNQFSLWYSQRGTPTIEVSSIYNQENQSYSLTFEQKYAYSTDNQQKPFLIPIRLALFGTNGEEIVLSNETGQCEETIALSDRQQTVTYQSIKEKPIPSILRNFSAPVILNYDYGDDELAVLSAHDTDPFNRWESSQRLALKTILMNIERIQRKTLPDYGDSLVDTFRQALKIAEKDTAFAAEVLTLPSASYVAEQMSLVDPEAILIARSGLKRHLAKNLEMQFSEAYIHFHENKVYSPDAVSAGIRSIKNIALSYLMELDDQRIRTVCLDQVINANNMTDGMAALTALANCDCPERLEALNWFYNKWQHEQLVIDKWFAVQATSVLPNTLEEVKKLLNHVDFDITNPNRVRSLISSFCQANHAKFHASDGSGYQFAAEQIIRLDKVNAQIAARLARSFDRWKKFDDKRQSLARKALITIKSNLNLSKDTSEVISRALA